MSTSVLMFPLRTPLHAAAYTDHVECLQLLLGHNAQVNAIDALGKTPLMMAAENGQTNAVGKTHAASFHSVNHNRSQAECREVRISAIMHIARPTLGRSFV